MCISECGYVHVNIDILRGQRHQITLELESQAMEPPTMGAGAELCVPGRTEISPIPELSLSPGQLVLREVPCV